MTQPYRHRLAQTFRSLSRPRTRLTFPRPVSQEPRSAPATASGPSMVSIKPVSTDRSAPLNRSVSDPIRPVTAASSTPACASPAGMMRT